MSDSPLQAASLVGLTRQMQQFFDATTDAVVFLDRDYNFTFLNRRATELIAFGRDLRGKNLFTEFPGVVYPESPYVSAYHRSMDEHLPAEFEAFYPEPMNQWLHIHSYPADHGIMVFFRDVTAERLSRQALQKKTEETQRQHAELQTIYDTAPIGLALFDLDDYHYLRLNERQAAFFGLKPEDIVGKTLTEMAPIEGLRELFDQVAAGEPVINFPLEGELFNDPGTHRYWTVSYFPVYGPDGAIQAITAASLEVTQQKKAEQALIQSEKLAVVGRLASSIAHEINNPLEAVTNLLYLAQHSTDLQEIRLHLNLAERELRRVGAITSQTLRFHKQSTSPQEITAEKIVESVLSIFQGRVLNSGVRIAQRNAASTPIRCFEGEIRQVVSNLVGNALDAMSASGGTLFLRSRETSAGPLSEPGVVLTIADTGTGMAPDTLSRLFNPFFTTKGITGTGLGLWVSREIVDRHRGSLRVRSATGPTRHGTVFSLFLPFDAVVR